MNRVQELQFQLMESASFNGFDGPNVVTSLRNHSDLWRGAVMDRLDSLIKLRDISDGYWNIDTLYILPVDGRENELMALAKKWGADEVDWIGGEQACMLLGSYSRGMDRKKKIILRVWWD
jgi:hypothetical protein